MERSHNRTSHSNDKMLPREEAEFYRSKHNSASWGKIKKLHNRKSRYRPVEVDQ